MKKSLLLAGLVLAAVAFAGSIKTWSTGETLKPSDLNANFQHIHNTMVGGHGARLVDADVSTTAAISHSKLATPALVPKAWVLSSNGGSGCTAATCAVSAGSKVSSIARTGTGVYTITLTYTPTDAFFAVVVTSANLNRSCYTSNEATVAPQITITCTDLATPTAADTNFSLLVLDDN